VQHDKAQKALSLANVTFRVTAPVLASLRYLIMPRPRHARCAVMTIAGQMPLTGAAHTMHTRVRLHLQLRWSDVRDWDVGMGVLRRKLDTQGHTLQGALEVAFRCACNLTWAFIAEQICKITCRRGST